MVGFGCGIEAKEAIQKFCDKGSTEEERSIRSKDLLWVMIKIN
jgi:hypothetical protein